MKRIFMNMVLKKENVKKDQFNCLSAGRIETTIISHHWQVAEVIVRIIKCQTDMDLTESAGFGKIMIF